MGEEIEVQATVESSAEDMAQKYSYVVHGAQAYCPMGSRPGRLTVPYCHGTYMHDMPIMTVSDAVKQTNVKCFGFCNSIYNPDRLEVVKKVMDDVEKAKGILNHIMDGISFLGNAIASAFGFSDEPDPNDPYHGYSEDVYKSVMVQCNPKLAVLEKWAEGNDRLKINGENALNSRCTLVCLNDCDQGLIQIMDDGQENAANEQSGAADMDSWKPGDPYPQATQGNLEALDASIANLDQQMLSASPEEYQRLKEERDAKAKMRDEMKATLDMVGEMQLQAQVALANRAYYDQLAQQNGSLTEEEAKESAKYESEYLQLAEDIQTAKTAFENGTPCVKVDDEQFNKDLNGTYKILTDDGNANDYFAQNPQSVPYDSFNGTPVTESNANDVGYLYCNGRLMSQSEYQQYTIDTANSMIPTEKVSWLTGQVISDEPREETTAEKVWSFILPGVKELSEIPKN